MKKLFTIIIAVLVIGGVSVRPVAAASKAEEQVRFAGKVKTGVEKLGSGSETRVEVKLRDKTRLKGYISQIGENEFVVTDVKSGASKSVAYADVKQIKGNNLSTGAKIAIGVSVAIGLILLISWLVVTGSD